MKKRNHIEIFVLSESLAKIHIKIFPDLRISVLPMGVAESFFVSRNPDQRFFSIGYLGKGHSSGFDNKLDLILSAAKILESENNLKFHFMGLEHDYKEMLEGKIENFGLSKTNFIFHDHVSHRDVPYLLCQLNVGLLPYPESVYNSERFPIKILEYAAAGLPIVASDTESHREHLDSSFTLFYESGDSRGLADAILRIRSDVKIQNSMSAHAKEFAEKFKYDERVKRLANIIEQI